MTAWHITNAGDTLSFELDLSPGTTVLGELRSNGDPLLLAQALTDLAALLVRAVAAQSGISPALLMPRAFTGMRPGRRAPRPPGSRK